MSDHPDLTTGYISRDEGGPDRFVLAADNGQTALVLLDNDWRSGLSKEDVIGLAAGAWEAVLKAPCTREQAEMITLAWFAAFEKNAARITKAHASSIILPAHHTQQ